MSVSSSTPYPTISFDSWDDIETAAKTRGVREIVSANIKRYQQINVARAMSDLSQVGRLLQIAYAGSQGFSCSSKVMEVMTKYQPLLKTASATSADFVNTSIESLELHEMALSELGSGKIDSAFSIFQDCADLAHKMAEESETLVKAADDLAKESGHALVSTVDAEVGATEKQKAVKARLAESEAKKAALSEEVTELAKYIEEAQREEVKAAEQAKDAHDRAFALSLVSAFMEPVTQTVSAGLKLLGLVEKGATAALLDAIENATKEENQSAEHLDGLSRQLDQKQAELGEVSDGEEEARIEQEIAELEKKKEESKQILQEIRGRLDKSREQLGEQGKSALDKEIAAAGRRRKLEDERIRANTELAEAVSRLQHLKIQKDDLSASIISLQLAVKTLGKVKTVFENTSAYWRNVEKQCLALSKTKLLERAVQSGNTEKFEELLKKSGLNWLALGKINLTAAQSMQEVDSGFDRVMQNLPMGDEASRLIQSVCPEIVANLGLTGLPE